MNKLPNLNGALLLFLGLPLASSGCATAGSDQGAALFHEGSDSDMAVAEDLAWKHMEERGALLGLADLGDLQVERVALDDLGMAHTRFRQTLNNVPVFGGEAIVHLNPNGALRGITNALLQDVSVDTNPDYTADEAVDLAVDATLGWESVTNQPAAELWILRHDGADHLVWRVRLEKIDGSNQPAIPIVFIDAHTGDVVWSYDNLQTGATTGTGTGYYSGSLSIKTYQSGSTYYLEDTTRGLGTYTYNNTTSSLYYCTDTDDAWTASNEAIWVEAHYASAEVYDYYLNVQGRNGIDGSGGPGYISSLTGSGSVISSLVNYSRSYANAYWDGNAMTYGDGDGRYFGPLTTVDIAGHEMTHGVTENESNLTYSGESGGLNESMSDIFGAAVEAYSDGAVSSDTWMVGEDADLTGSGLRSMSDPASDGYSLDYYTSSAGGYDVHYSSGISNLAFYLLSQGGSHPRGKSSTVVTGIGITEAAKIFYRANTTYLTSSSSFSGARTATLSAASDLYGASSDEYAQVQNAWAAVGVGSAASGGGGGTDTGGGGDASCTTETGSVSGSRKSSYEPSSSGFSLSASTTLTGDLAGPSSADFDLYLQKKSGSRWSTVASSTGYTSDESVSYSASSGTYRWRVYSYSGSGSYTLDWCE